MSMKFDSLINKILTELTENIDTGIQKDNKYFRNLSYRHKVSTGAIVNPSGKPWDPADPLMQKLTPEELAELEAWQAEQKAIQNNLNYFGNKGPGTLQARQQSGADYR